MSIEENEANKKATETTKTDLVEYFIRVWYTLDSTHERAHIKLNAPAIM